MINSILLMGRLGADPTQLDSGSYTADVCTTERGFITRDGRQIPEHTTWHRCYFFGRAANFLASSAHKGYTISLRGRYVSRQYTTDEGKQATFFCVEVEEVFTITPPAGSNAAGVR